jgi:glyoxylase-like metal-dependent hydrolase (beta-lactamase superfamily II)
MVPLQPGNRVSDVADHDHQMKLPVASPWFARRRIDDSITLLWEPHVHRVQQCNIWHLRGRRRDLIVDTGLGIASLRAAAEDLFEHALLAVATHFHYDHTGSLHEFEHRAIHRAEAKDVSTSEGIGGTLVVADIPEDILHSMIDAGYEMDGELLVSAIPTADYDIASYFVEPAAPTVTLDEGDVVDLGDRAFEVLHLPGHSPGSIGLWDVDSGVLFSGDAVYDGPLLDEIPGADLEAYVRTMELLHDLPVDVVHAGHDPSFGRDRLKELTRAYLDKRRSSLV